MSIDCKNFGYSNSVPFDILHIYHIKGKVQVAGELPVDYIGNWEDDGFSFLFFSNPSEKFVNEILSEQKDLNLLKKYEMSYDDWLGDKIVPFSVGNFFVSAPWEELKAKIKSNKNEKHIILDPGVVFGTGEHPTTNNCLELIEILYEKSVLKSVIDLGTGTGLLALAVCSLGAEQVIAVDYNYLAAKTTGNNINLNGMNRNIISVQGDARDFVKYDSDLIIANIHYDIMKDLIISKEF